jgi:hypothetical protein
MPQSALPFQNEDPAFAKERATMDRMGMVYRALRDRFGHDLDLQIVDPRNIALPVMLMRDSLARHVRLRDALRMLAQLPLRGIIVNGRIVDESAAPDPDAIVDLVFQQMAIEELTAV